MTAIILLNWNGWEVTIDCLRSLRKSTTDDFFIIVADNGSTDDSIEKISDFLNREWSARWYEIEEEGLEDNKLRDLSPKSCIILKLNDNYGFAKGNNKAVELADTYNPDYMMLLNNDTEVEPDSLKNLFLFAEQNPDYDVFTPLICYFSDKNLIWNAGGNLKFGLRKYNFPKSEVSLLPQDKSHLDITFITGCALLFRSNLVKDRSLLTEKFFYGEEDFEFSLRMKSQKRKMACVLTSKIYHKVSVSIKGMNNLGKIYIYYLNRFIDIRQHTAPMVFAIWRMAYIPYVKRLLLRQGFSKEDVYRLLHRLKNESRTLEGVSKELFFKVMGEGV